MRKVYLAGGVLALLLIAALGAYWLMQPCRALDGLFGPSE